MQAWIHLFFKWSTFFGFIYGLTRYFTLKQKHFLVGAAIFALGWIYYLIPDITYIRSFKPPVLGFFIEGDRRSLIPAFVLGFLPWALFVKDIVQSLQKRRRKVRVGAGRKKK